MSRLDPRKIDRLSGLMDARWAREFSEIRALVADLGEERQWGALGERAADGSDEALLDTLSAIDEARPGASSSRGGSGSPRRSMTVG